MIGTRCLSPTEQNALLHLWSRRHHTSLTSSKSIRRGDFLKRVGKKTRQIHISFCYTPAHGCTRATTYIPMRQRECRGHRRCSIMATSQVSFPVVCRLTFRERLSASVSSTRPRGYSH